MEELEKIIDEFDTMTDVTESTQIDDCGYNNFYLLELENERREHKNTIILYHELLNKYTELQKSYNLLKAFYELKIPNVY